MSWRERYQWREREKSMTQQEMSDNMSENELSSIYIMSGECKMEKRGRD